MIAEQGEPERDRREQEIHDGLVRSYDVEEADRPWYREPRFNKSWVLAPWSDNNDHPIRVLARRFNVPAWLVCTAVVILQERKVSEPFERLAHAFERFEKEAQ